MKYIRRLNRDELYSLNDSTRPFVYEIDNNKLLYSGLNDLSPSLMSKLCGVWIADQNMNSSDTRNIIKNEISGSGGDFEILNADYKLNSGYGKYEEDFNAWISSEKITRYDDSSFSFSTNLLWNLMFFRPNINRDVPSFKVSIDVNCKVNIYYHYINDRAVKDVINIEVEGIKEIELPVSYNTKYTGDELEVLGFIVDPHNQECTGTITQIPEYEGAFITDGVDDLIVSQKSVQEMLKGSDKITVVSMISQLSVPNDNNYTNTIRNQLGTTGSYNKVEVSAINKTGIYGYSFDSSLRCSIINNILGDKQDYGVSTATQVENIRARYLVQGWIATDNLAKELSSVAWYWTIIARDTLTSDEINQIIAFYKLDKYIKPDIYYDVPKQGLSNDTPDSDWYLKDFSGNNRDMTLFNFSKKLSSGIGRYSADFNSFDWTIGVSQNTSSKANISLNGRLCNHKAIEVDEMKVNIIGNVTELIYWYIADPDDSDRSEIRLTSGINTLPKSYAKDDGQTYNIGFAYISGDDEITIEQIPSYENALCFDGVNDYGQFVGDLGLKDYTITVDRAYVGLLNNQVPIISSILGDATTAPFMFEHSSLPLSNTAAYSFGNSNLIPKPVDPNRGISCQTTYSYNGNAIIKGNSVELGDGLTFGKYGDKPQYAKLALWSLLLFPYSLSEFLIERQLKKFKLGTLYPNQVEWRPIVRGNKSINKYYNVTQSKELNYGDYINIGDTIRTYIKTDDPSEEITKFTINGVLGTIVASDTENSIAIDTVVSNTLQIIEFQVDEYIRFEDIVQPYPLFFEFNDEKGNLFTWGCKARVGSTITRTKGVAYANLLEGLYTITNPRLNGVQLAGADHTVEKQMVFTCTATWTKDNNAPKCILSPSRLRIPNSSYSILNYIPDISGHGNHGKINNSAYAGMSGANGYLVNFNSWFAATGVDRTDNKVTLNSNYNLAETFVCYAGASSVAVPTFKVRISGIPNGGTLFFNRNSEIVNLVNGENTIEGFTSTTYSGFKRSEGRDLDWSNLVIEQVGEYEGAYCLDGVDDFITIPTLTNSGKQILMKINWNTEGYNKFIADFRGVDGDKYYIVNELGPTVSNLAYQNANKTYIDGIFNNNIKGLDLKGITHNITSQLASVNSSPYIGARTGNGDNLTMALYDFMLFDEISTDEEILTLNKYIGIEPKVTLPDYYWDAYGKSNTDEDKATIQQRGVAVGDYDLTNNNLSYEGMSGYNGYSVVFGIGKTYGGMPSIADFAFTTTPTTVNVTKFNTTHGLIYSYLKRNGVLENQNTDYPSYKIRVTGIEEGFDLSYYYLESPSDVSVKVFVMDADGIYTIPKSFASDGSLTNENVWVGFTFIGTAPESANVTIEVLPEYYNGLVLDGVDDHLINENIPAFTDYTYILKRRLLANTVNSASMFKGTTYINGGWAFITDYYNSNGKTTGYSFGNAAAYDINENDLFVYGTKTSVNGNSITPGSSVDEIGITIGRRVDKYKQMVFYKLMLYPKTLTNLEIMFLKNMFEKDEIIDLENPIFRINETK